MVLGWIELIIVLGVFLMTVALPVLLIFLAVRNRRTIVPVGAITSAPATVIGRREIMRGTQAYRQVTIEFADRSRRELIIASAVVPPLAVGDRGYARWADERLLGFVPELPSDGHRAD